MAKRSHISVEVAVAAVTNPEGQLLWVSNDRWGSFTLPMSKRRRGPKLLEPPQRAAMRAAAEALGVPVRVGPRWAVLPELHLSERSYAVRRYSYEVFPAEPHPDFAGALAIRQPHLAPG